MRQRTADPGSARHGLIIAAELGIDQRLRRRYRRQPKEKEKTPHDCPLSYSGAAVRLPQGWVRNMKVEPRIEPLHRRWNVSGSRDYQNM
jgi:hypothetical protein